MGTDMWHSRCTVCDPSPFFPPYSPNSTSIIHFWPFPEKCLSGDWPALKMNTLCYGCWSRCRHFVALTSEWEEEAHSNVVLHIFLIQNCRPAREYHECSFTRRKLHSAVPVASPFYLEHIHCAPNVCLSAPGKKLHQWAVSIFVFLWAVSFCVFVVNVYPVVVVFLLQFFPVKHAGATVWHTFFFIVDTVSRNLLGERDRDR